MLSLEISECTAKSDNDNKETILQEVLILVGFVKLLAEYTCNTDQIKPINIFNS